MAQPKVIRFAEISVVPRGSGVETKPLLLGSTGAESFVSGVSTFPVGAALKTHKHNTEEMVVLLEGEATVEAGGKRYDIGPYDTTHVPAGRDHRFINRGKQQGLSAERWQEVEASLRAIREDAEDKFKTRLGWMTRAHPVVMEGQRLLVPLYHDGFFLLVDGDERRLGGDLAVQRAAGGGGERAAQRGAEA